MSPAARTIRSRSFDIAVAAAFAVLAQIEVWGDLGDLAGQRSGDDTRWLSSVLMLGILALAWRRTRLLAAAVVVTGVVVTDTLLVSHTTGFFGEFGPMLVLVYTAAQRDTRQLVAPLAVVGAGYVAITAAIPLLHGPHDLLLNALTLLAAFVIGRLVRRLYGRNDELAARTEELERQRESHARAVLLVERGRIAREIHDVIAHTISLMGIQAAAAEHVLDKSPERAREPLRAIQQQAREAIEELRRLLGVLREDSESLGLSPQPGLAALGTLVDQMRAAGLPVTVEVAGDPHPLSPGVELSAYRIVQEALTNALKHAGPVPTGVRLHYGPETLDIEVTDRGSTRHRPGTQGHGLVGMRERVALHRGTFSSGPAASGGYVVQASLPVGQEP